MMIELQNTLSTIDRLEQFLSEGPSLLEKIDQHMKEEEEKVLSKKRKLEDLQKERRQEEGDLQLLNSRLEKYKDQLMAVKSNKEYTVMLQEIEQCEKDIEKEEEDIIRKMYEIDSLQNEVREVEENFKKARKSLEEQKANTEKDLSRAEQEIENLKRRREELQKGLPEDLLEEFTKILSIRGGMAVTRARDGICEACKIRIRPQVYIEVKSNSKIINCDHCDRFLYWEERSKKEGKSESEGDEAATTEYKD